MSDKTPDPTGASEPEHNALGDASDDQFDADAVEEASDTSSGATPAAGSGATPTSGRTRRRTTSAPVRRRGTVDPDADDAAIAELEGDFTEDELATVASVRRSSNAPVKKSTATRKRSDSTKVEDNPYTASNPAQFVKQSASEIKKVVWPTWSQLRVLFISVLIFVLFIIAFVGGLDLLFGWALLALFGDS